MSLIFQSLAPLIDSVRGRLSIAGVNCIAKHSMVVLIIRPVIVAQSIKS